MGTADAEPEPPTAAETSIGSARRRALDQWATDPVLLNLDDKVLAGLARLPLLGAEEEVQLGRAAEAGALAEERLAHPQAGDDLEELAILAAEGQAALRRLVLANVRFVAWFARKRVATQTSSLDYLDLVHEGLFGLVRAAHKWDYRRGLKFSTYAAYWIRSTQQRAVRTARGLSVAVDEQLHVIRHARDELTAELRRTPTSSEVSLRVGLSVARIAALETSSGALRLEQSLSGTQGATLADVTADPGVADPTDLMASVEEHELLHQMLHLLPARQQRVVRLRFGLDGQPPADVAQIARLVNVPQARVALTLDRALATLRTGLECDDDI